MVLPHARFVAKRPHYHRGVVLVTLVQALNAVKKGLLPFGAVGKIVPFPQNIRPVCLVIRFVHKINAVLVAKPGEARIVRVMAGADGVDVVALEDHQILDHVCKRHGRTKLGVAVVAIDAARLHLFAVDQQHAFFDRDIPEANEQADMLCATLQMQAIQMRCFVTPKQRCVRAKGEFALAAHGGVATVHKLSARRFQTVIYHCRTGCKQRNGGGCFAEILIQIGAHINVAQMHRIARKKIYLAENTRVTELVLIL